MTPEPRTASTGELFLTELIDTYRAQKSLAERALAQLDDDDWHRTVGAEDNSIAVIVRHLAGNLRSRWRDFLTEDGEKPDRQRDDEFEAGDHDRASILAGWEEGFATLFGTLTALKPEDLGRTVTIRGQPMTAMRAILRNLDHTGHHVGQIVLLAKQWRGESWTTLSIPKKRAG